MKCKECIEFLMAYLDGELPAEERAKFDLHIRQCPPCVRYVETYKKTVAMSKAAMPPCTNACAELPPELIKAILAARAKTQLAE